MYVEAKYINISKIDAAKRQLEHAIRLFFHSGDVVVIHALTTAAHELLEGLCKKQKIKSFMGEMITERVRPDKQKELRKMFRVA